MLPTPMSSLLSVLDSRPILVAVAGPNGAGKSTFYHTNLLATGLPFVNADVLAAGMGIDAYAAASRADHIRRSLVQQRTSFIFETVFSDPDGDKLRFLGEAAGQGYTVVLFYIGIMSAQISDMRVAIRVAKGGHDVPTEKLLQRFPRSLQNLKSALRQVEHVYVIDNSDLTHSFRLIAMFESGKPILFKPPLPGWLKPVLTEKGKLQS